MTAQFWEEAEASAAVDRIPYPIPGQRKHPKPTWDLPKYDDESKDER